VVLEKELELASQQTGHNSGVIHRGIYYKPGSLKAKLCVAGADELVRYCEEQSVPYRLCGKMIVATDPSELGRLEDLAARCEANGVPDVRIVDRDELREREPHCQGIRALWSPNTGIVDYRLVSRAYANEIRAMGGEIRLDHSVSGMQRFGKKTVVRGGHSEFKASAVIACAGLYSDRVASLSGAAASPVIVPFRGDYFVLRPDRRYLVNSNIYPVPDPRFPFLGVHFTPRVNGDIWLGPNAVLAFSRTGYEFANVNVRDLRSTFGSKGFRTFARRNWRTGFAEMERDLRKTSFLKSLQRYVPELTEDDLLPGPSGVRAQALTETGDMVDDFVIDEQPGILHVRNAPSPAATSSLQIGSYVVNRLAGQFPEYAASADVPRA
jgi:L-2-hydroxyglutarate oxidase LhgO